jgi:hypothetical protein
MIDADGVYRAGMTSSDVNGEAGSPSVLNRLITGALAQP